MTNHSKSPSFEGSLPHIIGFNWYLVVPRLQVNLAEIFGPLEPVFNFINLWDWIPIWESDIIQCLIVNTKSLGAIFLLYQHNRASTG